MKKTFTRKEVVEILRDYCRRQRILSQLPLCGLKGHISDELIDNLCDVVKDKADIEKFGGFKF